MSDDGGLVVGVDVGGTFTDVFAFDPADGSVRVAKAPSTPSNQANGFLNALDGAQAPPGAIASLVHGTTVATNALLQRRGGRTGLITTRGMRDVLEMRRRDRPATWGLWGTYEPVIPRDLRLEVDERMLADGSVHTPVSLRQVREAARQLLEAEVEALVIFFVNAYANPASERAARDALRELWPNAYLTISSDILPEIREFERISTTALNAFVQPVVGRYLQALEGRLADGGFSGELMIVQSNGGVMSAELARARPVRTALSGPAAGVIAGAQIAEAAGFPNVITCDMGGTSFDVSLVAGGAVAQAAETAVDFGLVIRTPMIEITTIGAGGGSIARVDRAGLLRVGPESAGSDPGPACYGLGNDRPTVTDANVLLGRINAARPIGDTLIRLDAEAAEAAILEHVGAPLGLDAAEAAAAILRVANASMAGAIRLVSIERGHDPRRFVAMPFGGGGALHVGALIREVGLAGALVPRYPGVTSALGCALADMRYDFVQTLNQPLDGLDEAVLAAHIRGLTEAGGRLLDKAGLAFEARRRQVELDMLYQGQTHSVAVDLGEAEAPGREAVAAAFDRAYEAAFGRLLAGIPRRVINLRVAVTGVRPRFDLAALAPDDGSVAVRERRRAWTGEGWQEVPVYDRLALPVGGEIAGPAILEQPDATIFLEPGLAGRVDRFGNLVIERRAGP